MKFSPLLRPRIKKIKGSLIGKIFNYYPINMVTANPNIKNGQIVEVVSDPAGSTIQYVSVVVYGGDEEKTTVFVKDLSYRV